MRYFINSRTSGIIFDKKIVEELNGASVYVEIKIDKQPGTATNIFQVCERYDINWKGRLLVQVKDPEESYIIFRLMVSKDGIDNVIAASKIKLSSLYEHRDMGAYPLFDVNGFTKETAKILFWAEMIDFD